MAAFNFDFTEASAVEVASSSLRQLTPYEVHTVKLDSVEYNDNDQYKRIEFSVSNNDGQGRLSIFIPTMDARDVERTTGQYGQNPSNAELFMATLSQLMLAFNPEKYEAAKAAKIKSFEDAAKVCVRVLKSAIGTETLMKFHGRWSTSSKDGNVYANLTLPRFILGISRNANADGKFEAYTKDIIAGPKTVLSQADLKAKDKFYASKPGAPTPMPATADLNTADTMDVSDINVSHTKGSEDFDEFGI